jgi:hypothetical protein
LANLLEIASVEGISELGVSYSNNIIKLELIQLMRGSILLGEINARQVLLLLINTTELSILKNLRLNEWSQKKRNNYYFFERTWVAATFFSCFSHSARSRGLTMCLVRRSFSRSRR